jgi:hypothetical protein
MERFAETIGEFAPLIRVAGLRGSAALTEQAMYKLTNRLSDTVASGGLACAWRLSRGFAVKPRPEQVKRRRRKGEAELCHCPSAARGDRDSNTQMPAPLSRT